MPGVERSPPVAHAAIAKSVIGSFAPAQIRARHVGEPPLLRGGDFQLGNLDPEPDGVCGVANLLDFDSGESGRIG